MGRRTAVASRPMADAHLAYWTCERNSPKQVPALPIDLASRTFDGTTMQIIHEEPRPIDDQIIVSFEIRVS